MYFDRGRRLVTFFLSPESVPYRAAQTEDERERDFHSRQRVQCAAHDLYLFCARRPSLFNKPRVQQLNSLARRNNKSGFFRIGRVGVVAVAET
jgi:hypothetical protein